MERIIATMIVVLILIAGISIFVFTQSTQELSMNEQCVMQGAGVFYFVKAIKEQNTGLCDQTFNPPFCEAILNKDPLGCEADTCKAYVLKDSSLCEEDDHFCKAYTQDNQEECLELEGNEQRECLAFTLLDEEAYSISVLEKECAKLTIQKIDVTNKPKITLAN